jgi:hypothetical protein
MGQKVVEKNTRDLPDVVKQPKGESARRRLGMLDELIERRITEAMREGEFDDLPGKGKPLDLQEPYGDHGNWLALKILRNSGFVTDEVRYRKEIEILRARLESAESQSEAKALVREINAIILKLNTMGTNIKPTDIAPLSEDEYRIRYGKR